MTILDSQLQLSASQAVTVTAVSANTLDLVSVRDIGSGLENAVYFSCEVAAAAAGAATVNFQLITSANSNLSSPTIIGQTDAIPKGNLLVGTRIVIPIPRSFLNTLGQRYFGLQYTVGTGPLTAGTFTARITQHDVSDGNVIYPLNAPVGAIPGASMQPANAGVPTGFGIR